jgi:hypothetical protein
MRTTNWQELSSSSHYQTAVAVEEALQRGDTVDATAGIQELIDALARSEKRALRSQLTRLMAHIIKWKTQPTKRSLSWRASINNARNEIEDIQEETPSLNRQAIEQQWDRCFKTAMRDAEVEMDQAPSVTKLSWNDVFVKQYELLGK